MTELKYIGKPVSRIDGLDKVTGAARFVDDLDFGPGICGKGQNAEVNAGQPTVRIRGINVGGTRA